MSRNIASVKVMKQLPKTSQRNNFDFENSNTSLGTVSEGEVSVHNEEERKGFYEVTTALEPYQYEPLAFPNNEEIKDDDADINGIHLETLEARFEKRQLV